MINFIKERVQLICWVCKRPVDKLTQIQEIENHCITFVAECHGQKEEVSLSESDLVAADSISLGYAFQPRETMGYTRKLPLKEDLCSND